MTHFRNLLLTDLLQNSLNPKFFDAPPEIPLDEIEPPQFSSYDEEIEYEIQMRKMAEQRREEEKEKEALLKKRWSHFTWVNEDFVNQLAATPDARSTAAAPRRKKNKPSEGELNLDEDEFLDEMRRNMEDKKDAESQAEPFPGIRLKTAEDTEEILRTVAQKSEGFPMTAEQQAAYKEMMIAKYREQNKKIEYELKEKKMRDRREKKREEAIQKYVAETRGVSQSVDTHPALNGSDLREIRKPVKSNSMVSGPILATRKSHISVNSNTDAQSLEAIVRKEVEAVDTALGSGGKNASTSPNKGLGIPANIGNVGRGLLQKRKVCIRGAQCTNRDPIHLMRYQHRGGVSVGNPSNTQRTTSYSPEHALRQERARGNGLHLETTGAIAETGGNTEKVGVGIGNSPRPERPNANAHAQARVEVSPGLAGSRRTETYADEWAATLRAMQGLDSPPQEDGQRRRAASVLIRAPPSHGRSDGTSREI